jgi:hypothetical protein
MLKLITGNPALFLLIWFLIYAGLLFGLSVVLERRRRYRLSNTPAKQKDHVFPLELPHQMSGRREWPRREGNPTAVLVSQPGGPEWVPGAWVVNRSRGGLRLRCPRPFNTGQVLRVLSSYAPNKVLWADVQVRNCRQGRDGFELGCQFVYAHPLNVVLLFG